MEYIPLLIKNNAFLIQRPICPFFKKFSASLTENGVKVHKINFHLGEHFFYHKQAFLYNKSPSEWHNFLSEFILKNNIQQVFCLGKNKFYHKVAFEISAAHN